MSNALAVVNCTQLVTLAGPARPRVAAELSELEIIEDGAMLVRDGQIERVGSRREIESLVNKNTEVVDAGGRIILPGFVDAHAHPVFAGTRANEFEERASGATYQEIAARGGGIQSTVRATRRATLDQLVQAGKKYADWFLRCGTTTVETKSGYGLTLEDELKILRVMRSLNEQSPLEIVPTFLGAHAVPREMDADEYIELLIAQLLPRIAMEKLAESCDVFCERGYFDVEQSRKILTA